jgi:16S rRNA (adenine1518-N6/adenine1519-N6)-dimethyltransferase
MQKVEPKKRLGQHFFKDKGICEKIANLYGSQDVAPKIVEIGPGMGALTEFLLKRTELDTWCMEVDDESVRYLDLHFPQLKGKVIFGDFLREDLSKIIDGKKIGVIGNFPYNISSQIMIKALDNRDNVPEVVGMFQREVGERIAAGPGNKEYGVLSVLMQAYYDIKYLFTVKPGSFNPPPKVMSGVIALSRKVNYRELGCNDHLFRIIVKAAFNQRRKMLRNSLKPFLPKDIIESDTFYEFRPEQLSVQQFVFLTNQVEKFREKDSV